MNNNQLAIILGTIGLSAIAFAFLNKPKYKPYRPQSIPPQPPKSNQGDWMAWASLILGQFGNIAELWQPGGPFYKSEKDIENLLNVVPGTHPDYNINNDPYPVPGAWV